MLAAGFAEKNLKLIKGGIEFQARLNRCMAFNLNLRSPLRILMRVGNFKADSFEKLEKKILPITQNLEIYEEIEREGRKVSHWTIPTWEKTLIIGDKLKEFTENPNMIFLKLKANNDASIEDVTLKDLRKYKKS